MNSLFEATPRQLLIAAGLLLVASLVLAEIVLTVDRLVMARYDPAKLSEEVEEYLEQRDREQDEPGG
jgi:hypothetical protein